MRSDCRSVREGALGLLAEFYAQSGSHMTELLRQYNIKGPQQREIDECFSEIDPVQGSQQKFARECYGLFLMPACGLYFPA